MLVVDGITMQEHAIDEPVPLAQIQRAVLEFVTGRDTLVVFGAHAVNAYVAEPRMTQDIDLLSTQAADDAESLRAWLADRFHISVRVHEVASGAGYRVYQIRKPRNRHLIDVRQVGALPSVHMVDGIPVIAPADLVASKVLSFVRRRGQPKSGTDWRDIAELLLAFPELKSASGPVAAALSRLEVDDEVHTAWRTIVAQDIATEDDEGGLDWDG